WLIKSDLPDRFVRFVASSLKDDLIAEETIRTNIAGRGSELPIETRMLASIAHYRAESGLDLGVIQSEKNLPDLKTMVSLCLPQDWYRIVQKSPSKITHPSWYDLRRHYLEPNSEGELRPTWCKRPPHPGNYFGPAALALI